jgi:hypothetical protein
MTTINAETAESAEDILLGEKKTLRVQRVLR